MYPAWYGVAKQANHGFSFRIMGVRAPTRQLLLLLESETAPGLALGHPRPRPQQPVVEVPKELPLVFDI